MAMVTCTNCSGTGRLAQTEVGPGASRTCPWCQGTGRFDVSNPISDAVRKGIELLNKAISGERR